MIEHRRDERELQGHGDERDEERDRLLRRDPPGGFVRAENAAARVVQPRGGGGHQREAEQVAAEHDRTGASHQPRGDRDRLPAFAEPADRPVEGALRPSRQQPVPAKTGALLAFRVIRMPPRRARERGERAGEDDRREGEPGQRLGYEVAEHGEEP